MPERGVLEEKGLAGSERREQRTEHEFEHHGLVSAG
jgi:hypothetical protein